MKQIIIKNLTLQFDKKKIFADLSFIFTSGTVTLIQGSNGAGKTCLLQCICGIIPRFFNGEIYGAIEYQGIEVDFPRTFSFLWQEPDKQLCFPFLEEELFCGAENLGRPTNDLKSDYEMIITDFPFLQRNDTQTFNLSLGQKKILLFAGMFLKNSEVYLLDEPCAGLSEEFRQKIYSWVEKLQQRGKIIIIAEHDNCGEKYGPTKNLEIKRKTENDVS